jgi:dTDP-glucose pyrophosphorylase
LLVPERATLLEAMRAIEDGAQAIALVRNGRGRAVGLVTDGDIRRAILAGRSLNERCLGEVMNRQFRRVSPSASRAEVLDLMRSLRIEHVPVLDQQGRLKGLHVLQRMVGTVERENWAVIMCGGQGMRLRPLTEHLPKPMIRVAGRPILERLVLHLVSHGIHRIFLAVNYLAHTIEDHFEDGSRYGCKMEYLREKKPLGTGGALSLLGEHPKCPLLVMNGDLVTQFDVKRMLDFHDEGKFAVTFGLRPHNVEIPFGVAEVRGSKLVGMQEKPTHRLLINAGIYVLSPRVVSLVPKKTEFPITQLVDVCSTHDLPMGAHLIEDEWTDVGHHDELNRARGRV